MNTVCEQDICNGCMACIDKCPKNCISIIDDVYAYNAVKSMDICINCGQCEKVCPNNNMSFDMIEPGIWKQGWAEGTLRKNSSSGGAASAIVKSFIQSGGYVASCLFINGQFLFELTNDLEIAKKFAGSKYVKSNPVGIYKKIQKKLITNKVLFLGLPCQIAGLKNYINNQENLYTIDLICHGTPSPKLLSDYLKELKIDIKKVFDIKFRDKTKMGLIIDNHRLYPCGIDDYMLSFLDSVTYTQNCYMCKYAQFTRISDMTIGDCWGTNIIEEEDKGISLILVSTQKGKSLLENIPFVLKDVDIYNAREKNHQLNHPSNLSEKRTLFFIKLKKNKSFSKSVFAVYKIKIVKRYIKMILMKFGMINKK